MPKIEPAFCQRLSLQFLLVTSLCVIECSVREWDVAVAMLTLGKICTADVTKEIRSSFSKSCSLLHSSFFFFLRFISTHISSRGTLGSTLTCGSRLENTPLRFGSAPEKEQNV